MRRLALLEIDALAAQAREPRLPGFDLALMGMLADAVGPGAADSLLAAAVADAGGCTSLAQFVGLLDS